MRRILNGAEDKKMKKFKECPKCGYTSRINKNVYTQTKRVVAHKESYCVHCGELID